MMCSKNETISIEVYHSMVGGLLASRGNLFEARAMLDNDTLLAKKVGHIADMVDLLLLEVKPTLLLEKAPPLNNNFRGSTLQINNMDNRQGD